MYLITLEKQPFFILIQIGISEVLTYLMQADTLY